MSEYTERELHMLAALREIWHLLRAYENQEGDYLACVDMARNLAFPFVFTGPQETEPKP
jgi:hypothetical protein